MSKFLIEVSTVQLADLTISWKYWTTRRKLKLNSVIILLLLYEQSGHNEKKKGKKNDHCKR